MPPIQHRVTVRSHPGSTHQEISNEPDWGGGHEHRVGFRNLQNRVPGLTHSGDEREDSDESQDVVEEAAKKYHDFAEKVEEGKLVNFRDVINAQEDLHLRRPNVHAEGWRYVLNATEDWIKNTEEWPANLQKKQKDEATQKKEQSEIKQVNNEVGKTKGNEDGEVQQEHEWRRGSGNDNKHHDAYTGRESDADKEESSGDKHEKSTYEILRMKYSPQEIALLHSLQHEKDYIANLEQNDGNRKSPVTHPDPLVSIDEADQFTPDNWIPRSPDLIRLTGKVRWRFSAIVLLS